eukprot:1494341-Heterocapsa_arctica.AAC.1
MARRIKSDHCTHTEHVEPRPIAILPYICRVWMAARKSKVKQWATHINDGRFSSPGTLLREIAARGELARLTGKHFSAAYIDCSKCYDRVNHKVAANAAVTTGCKSTIVSLSLLQCTVQNTQSDPSA